MFLYVRTIVTILLLILGPQALTFRNHCRKRQVSLPFLSLLFFLSSTSTLFFLFHASSPFSSSHFIFSFFLASFLHFFSISDVDMQILVHTIVVVGAKKSSEIDQCGGNRLTTPQRRRLATPETSNWQWNYSQRRCWKVITENNQLARLANIVSSRDN